MTVIAEFLFALGFDKVDTSNLDDAERKATGSADKVDRSWSKAGASIGKAGLAIAAATTGAAVGLFKLAEGAAEAANETAKTAKGLSIASDGLQKLEFATGRATKATSQDLHKALGILTLGLEDAAIKGTGPVAEGLDAIGLSAEDLKGQKIEDQFGIIADAVRQLPEETDRTAAAMKLFGAKGGAALKPLLDEGADGIRNLGNEAERLGLILDKDALTASEEFVDVLSDTKKTVAAVAREVGLAAVPAIQDAAGRTKEWTVENQDLIDQNLPLLVEQVTTGMTALATATLSVAGALADVRDGFDSVRKSTDDTAVGRWILGLQGIELDSAGRRVEAGTADRYNASSREHERAFAAGEYDTPLRTRLRDDETAAIVPASDALGGFGPSDSTISGAERARLATQQRIAEHNARAKKDKKDKENKKNRPGRGRRRRAPDDGLDAEALELFGDEIRRLAGEGGVGEIAIDAALKSAAGSLRSGANQSVARKSALSRLGGLAGKDFNATADAKDPLLSEIFGEDVPDVELSSLARGAQPQTLVSTINNTFNIQNAQEINGAGDPASVGNEAATALRDVFEGSVAASTKTAKVNFAR